MNQLIYLLCFIQVLHILEYHPLTGSPILDLYVVGDDNARLPLVAAYYQTTFYIR